MRCGIIEQLDMLSHTHRARYILTEITQDAIFSLYGLQPRPGGHLQRHPDLHHRPVAVQPQRVREESLMQRSINFVGHSSKRQPV